MSILLRAYIRQILSEIQDYRVPNQLISKDGGKKSDKPQKQSDDRSEEEIDEIGTSGGGEAGFTVPLGVSGDDLRKKKSPQKTGWN